MKKLFWIFLLIFIASPVFSAGEKTMRMVTAASFPPYEYYEGTEIVGIDVDILREVLRRNGYDMEIEDMNFDSIIAAVEAGKGDVAASALTVTEDRKKTVDFTIDYVTANQVILVKKDSKVASSKDLKGIRIGVQGGTTGDEYVKSNIQEPERFTDANTAVAALIRGKLDAVVVDYDPAAIHVAKNESLKMLPEPLTSQKYAFAVKKGRPQLLNMLNKTLAEMHKDGTIKSIQHKYAEKTAQIVIDTAETSENQSFKDILYTNFVKDNRWRYLYDGFIVTITVAFFAVLLGVSLGFFVAVIRSTADLTGKLRIANLLCRIYLTVIRGTPVVLQLMIIYFVVFGSMDVSKVLVAVIAFGINSGAYVAEIIRSGIMSIDRGQMEAGRSLGLSYCKTMLLIILPQAFKNVLPALGNEFIVLLKETSVCGFIALQDLTKGGDIIRSQTYNAFLPLIAVALIYLIMLTIFSFLQGVLEKRLKKNEQ